MSRSTRPLPSPQGSIETAELTKDDVIEVWDQSRGESRALPVGKILSGVAVAEVADKASRLALDRPLGWVTQVDTPGVLWALVGPDPSASGDWVGLPYTTRDDGALLVSLELADISGTIPDAHTLARRGSALVKGDGVTTGGILVESPHNEITMVIVGSNNAKFYYVNNTFGAVDGSVTYASIGTAVSILGANVFSGSNITAYSIPNSVVEFEEYCFASSSLASIKIPDSVTTLGESCFSLTPLTTITIPASVTSIGDGVFEDCSNLVEVNCFVPETVFGAGVNVLNTQGLPITLHVRSDDNTWDALVAASPSSYQGNTVTVVKDL